MPATRLNYLRNSNYGKFIESINESIAREPLANKDMLRKILVDHWRWHKGDFDDISDLYHIETEDPLSKKLASIYKAFSLNTYGLLNESFSLLTESLQMSSDLKNNVERYVGESIDPILHSWKIWNTVEMQDYFKAIESMKYAENLIRNGYGNLKKSSVAQLFLAIGVMLMRLENFKTAETFLLRAATLLKSESIWLPRVHSALSVTDFHLGKVQSSKAYLEKAILGVGTHFGPMGWQLRIAEALILNENKDEAATLIKSILIETEKKKEYIYHIWAYARLLELDGNQISVDKYHLLFSSAAYKEMKHAALFFIRKDLIKYD